MHTKAYENWLNSQKKAETLDQAMYILANEITKRGLLEQMSEETCDEKITSIHSLRDCLGKFTDQDHKRPFETIKCEEITVEFVENFRLFLTSENGHDGGEMRSLGEVLFLSKKYEIAEWDSKVFDLLLP